MIVVDRKSLLPLRISLHWNIPIIRERRTYFPASWRRWSIRLVASHLWKGSSLVQREPWRVAIFLQDLRSIQLGYVSLRRERGLCILQGVHRFAHTYEWMDFAVWKVTGYFSGFFLRPSQQVSIHNFIATGRLHQQQGRVLKAGAPGEHVPVHLQEVPFRTFRMV